MNVTQAPELTIEQVLCSFAARAQRHAARRGPVRGVLDVIELFQLQLDPVPGSHYHVVRRGGPHLIVEYDPGHPRVAEHLWRACAYALRCTFGRDATHIPIGDLAAGLMRFCRAVSVATVATVATAANQQTEHAPRVAWRRRSA
jgi:hypothetical protein